MENVLFFRIYWINHYYGLYIYISSVYSQFSDRVGLPLLNIPSSEMLMMKNMVAPRIPYWRIYSDSHM